LERNINMARTDSKHGCGIVEEPKGSGRWWVRIYHRGHRYKRRAVSKSHARQMREEVDQELMAT
jgi:hypothetical protein